MAFCKGKYHGTFSLSISVSGSFSFGRALQQRTLKAWAGKEENIPKAEAALLIRCEANSETTLGTYKGDAQLGEGASESLHVKDYKN